MMDRFTRREGKLQKNESPVLIPQVEAAVSEVVIDSDLIVHIYKIGITGKMKISFGGGLLGSLGPGAGKDF